MWECCFLSYRQVDIACKTRKVLGDDSPERTHSAGPNRCHCAPVVDTAGTAEGTIHSSQSWCSEHRHRQAGRKGNPAPGMPEDYSRWAHRRGSVGGDAFDAKHQMRLVPPDLRQLNIFYYRITVYGRRLRWDSPIAMPMPTRAPGDRVLQRSILKLVSLDDIRLCESEIQ